MNIELVVFDVDGTLTKHSSVWWRLHEHFGTTEEGKLYYDQYFAGEITYDQWADLDASLWKGKTLSEVMKVVYATQLSPSAEEVISILKKHGLKTAILSGGLDIMADDIGRRVGIDYVLTNVLRHQDGILTGEVKNHVAWGKKSDVISQICEHFQIPLEKTAFVGDGRNDVSVFSVVGLSIAYNPEDQDVADAADVVIRENDLRAILPYFIQEYLQ
ncbi:MAG: HAD family hydrolase [Candidatus Thorarchaeota archaeon]